MLLGDHPGARVQFPPSYRALLLRGRGIGVWAGLNCRDRNRVALEGELARTIGSNDQLRTAPDYKNLVVKSANGAVVRLGAIADQPPEPDAAEAETD